MSYMSEISKETAAPILIDEAVGLLSTAAQVLSIALDDFNAGRLDQASASAGYGTELRKALDKVIGEKQCVERLRQQLGVLDPKRELDFDAARSEVGRRLARLRGAGGLG